MTPGEVPVRTHTACMKDERTNSIGGSNRMLSVRETAELLGVPLSTIYSQWRGWGLKAYRVGRALKFREREIESWLQGHAA